MFNGEKFSVWILFSIPYQFNGFEKPYQILNGNTVAEADFFTHSPLSMWKISKEWPTPYLSKIRSQYGI
jgi:hypothetical protein